MGHASTTVLQVDGILPERRWRGRRSRLRDGAGAAPRNLASRLRDGAGAAPRNLASRLRDGAGAAPRHLASRLRDGAGAAPRNLASRLCAAQTELQFPAACQLRKLATVAFKAPTPSIERRLINNGVTSAAASPTTPPDP